MPELAPAFACYCSAFGLALNRLLDDVAELTGGESTISLLENASGSRCITFSDPFGRGFCRIEFIGDGYRDGIE